VIGLIELLSRNLPAETAENHEYQNIECPVRDSNRAYPESISRASLLRESTQCENLWPTRVSRHQDAQAYRGLTVELSALPNSSKNNGE
jgi:hypothetical protein